MRRLPLETLAPVFEPFRGKRLGYVRPRGNVGDLLIEWATFQLFDVFGIPWKTQNPHEPADDVDELVFGGGGNMGCLYKDNQQLRRDCLRLGPPLTILPQSFFSRGFALSACLRARASESPLLRTRGVGP